MLTEFMLKNGDVEAAFNAPGTTMEQVVKQASLARGSRQDLILRHLATILARDNQMITDGIV